MKKNDLQLGRDVGRERDPVEIFPPIIPVSKQFQKSEGYVQGGLGNKSYKGAEGKPRRALADLDRKPGEQCCPTKLGEIGRVFTKDRMLLKASFLWASSPGLTQGNPVLILVTYSVKLKRLEYSCKYQDLD